MSDKPHRWGHEHFCGPDLSTLYRSAQGGELLNDIGFPVALDAPPEPPTFCSSCLQWFDEAEQHTEGSEHRPPQKGTEHG